ncbi:hypothetical protein Tco_1030021 [Tanacetum coccineum]|uniref:Uncharacterized protein n=1 Tax=Tanacetum coccineum TaxID=301880 RepID=A0ABQ5G5E8_9ASTR
MHNNSMAVGSRIATKACNRTISTIGDQGSYDTLNTRTKMVMPYGRAFSQSLYSNNGHNTCCCSATEDSHSNSCKTSVETAQEMRKPSRVQQGESLNIQDVKTNLFWEFGQFTSHDGETIESYYTRFYKMMNEMIRNNLTVATMQVNVQFPFNNFKPNGQDLSHCEATTQLDEVSYHKLFRHSETIPKGSIMNTVLKRMAKNAKPISTLSHAATRHKGKEIAKPITPPSESASEEDSDPEQAQKDKDMQKNLALIAKCAGVNKLRKAFNFKQSNLTDWLADTDEEIDEQELEAHYSYMAKIQEVPNADSGTDAEPLEQVHYDTDHNVFANDLQHLSNLNLISNHEHGNG